MNPTELRMLWMGQYGGDRMVLDESTSFYGQPTVGLSVMDELPQPGSMELNPMMSIVGGEYSGQAAASALAAAHTAAAPPTAIIATGNPSEIYGLPAGTVGSLHQVLQHSTFTPAYHDMVNDEDDDVDDQNHHQFTTSSGYEQMEDSNCYDSNVMQDNSKPLMNIDDFVMMNSDSNSYQEAAIMDDPLFIESKQRQPSAGAGQKKARKIEPVKRPGLVLKTPIAYQGNIDPSVIPIQRDGMAVCERCGAIGVRHTFYTKSRRYCSMACARGELYNLVCKDKLSNNSNSNSRGGHNALLSEQGRTNLELELRVSHLGNSNYRFKMANESPVSVTNGSAGENGVTGEVNRKPVLYRDIIPQDEVPQLPKSERLPSPCPQDDKIYSVRRKQYEFMNSFDWTPELSNPDFFAAPVTCFSHAPGYDMWDNIGVDMKVEVENTDCDSVLLAPNQTPHSFWVATVLKICGYKALMRYEGFEDPSHDFWVNLCSSEVHSVGWCATRGKPLIPPRTIENKYTDWKDFLVERLSGAQTLPSNFYNKISDSFKSRFRCGLNLEVVDKNRISQVKLATVHKIVGKRLYIKYFDSPDDGFWCHEDSVIIHPVGWATTVGHNLAAPQDYSDRMIAGREQMIEVHEDDATIELFKMNFTFEEYYLEGRTNGFVEGMKLEAVDPLNLSSICVATVMAVLKFGYMMIRIDSYDPDATGADWFCYHEKSPSIFPVGFCAANGIQLTPPNGYSLETFEWGKYLEDTNSLPASEDLFHREVPDHGFQVGMKLECADLMDPRLVCVATIARIVGRLLKVGFDGWPEEYDQWLDSESPDFYPVGWCFLVGYRLEGPPAVQQKPPSAAKVTKKKRPKKKGKSDGSVRNRNVTILKKESTDSMKHQNNLTLTQQDKFNIKMEMKSESHLDEDEDEEYDDDEMSHPDQSTSLPPTPEPIKITISSTTGVSINTNGSSCSGSNTSSGVQKSASTSPAPPPERKATSYIGNSSVTNSKCIPRLTSDASPDLSTTNQQSISPSSAGGINSGLHSQSSSGNAVGEILPDTWNIYDVSQFLRINDCTAHCDTFSRNKIDGKRLMQLTKDEIITLLGMKVGPALKIFDIIQQLKSKINPGRSRLIKANTSKNFL